MLHWELARLEGFHVISQWRNHKPLPSVCGNGSKLLWDFTIQTNQHLPHNRPDIVYVYVSSSRNHVYLIDVAVPGDERMASKFQEKRTQT